MKRWSDRKTNDGTKEHRVIAIASSHHRTIAPSPRHCRAIASSSPRYRIIVIAPSCHRHRVITLSTLTSMVRWCDIELHGPIRIPYDPNHVQNFKNLIHSLDLFLAFSLNWADFIFPISAYANDNDNELYSNN